MKVICIDGNIGAGKTTVLNELKARGYYVFEEDLDYWGVFLERYYNDEKRWMCTLQLAILYSMKQQYRTIQELDCRVVFVERSPDASLIFAKNGRRLQYLDAAEYDLVLKMHEALRWKPDCSFYIDTSTVSCMERIALRGRPCEKNIKTEYIEYLSVEYADVYDQIDSEAKLGKTWKVDGSRSVSVIVDEIIVSADLI